jgi:galactokinase
LTGDAAASRVAAELERPRDAAWFRAPGRVNLVGDHTDYNGGYVLPIAIDRACVVAARPAGSIRVRSLDAGDTVEIAADGSEDPAAVRPHWGRYVAGVVSELARRGRPPVGIEAVLASEVPAGSGLSSSAALEIACALALVRAARWEVEADQLAEACRSAEERATGVPCGIMDQLTSLAGRAGAAMLLDCRSLERTAVPLPDDLRVLVVHSGVSRSLATSPYADRRRACEELARELGVASLRDATEDQVRDHPLGRHVVSENARVLDAAVALEAGDLDRLGRVLSASHASLARDFGVSTPELDALVDELVSAGAYGARLTGGGFGGCVVAACDAAAVAEVAESAIARYRRRTGREPRSFVCRAVEGAGPLDAPPGRGPAGRVRSVDSRLGGA